MILLFALSLSDAMPYNACCGSCGPVFLPYGFGEIVDSFEITLDSSYTLGGITFCSRDSLFYISDLFGRKAWSFNPLNPNGALTQRFAFQDVFGDGFYDWHFGIAWADTSFFVTSVSAALDSAAISEYSYTGNKLRTWRLDSLAKGWFAGLDYDYNDNLIWLVNVKVGSSGTNKAYAISPDSPDVALDSAFQWTSSQRGLAYFGFGHDLAPFDTITWLLVGGWNDDLLYCLDADDPDHTGLESVFIMDMADLDIWEDTSNTDSVFAFVSVNGPRNMLYKVFMGKTWEEWFTPPRVSESPYKKNPGLALRPNPSEGRLMISGLGQGFHSIRIYNSAGVLIREERSCGDEIELLISERGVYFIESGGKTAKAVIQ
ncbi:MAG: hypothetical protein ABIM74_03770 [candidate division WOR-3 bacterium]